MAKKYQRISQFASKKIYLEMNMKDEKRENDVALSRDETR